MKSLGKLIRKEPGIEPRLFIMLRALFMLTTCFKIELYRIRKSYSINSVLRPFSPASADARPCNLQ
jgi:hypothetical protein